MGFACLQPWAFSSANPARDGRLRHWRGPDPDVHPGLSTCKQYRLPIKIVNLNNKYMGMVRQWQQFFTATAIRVDRTLCPTSSSSRELRPRGIKVEEPGDVEPALKEAFNARTTWCSSISVTDQPRTSTRLVQGGKGLNRDDFLPEELLSPTHNRVRST